MNANDLFNAVNTAAVSFGMIKKENETSKGNAVVRKNIEPLAFQAGAEEAYFGYISPEEECSGPYSDLSLVIFPQKDGGACVVALGVGSSGFSNDYPLAQLPGLRRSFLRLMSDDGRSFCKTTFTDTTSSCQSLPEISKGEDDPYTNLRNQIKKYENVIQASRILEPDKEDDMKILKAWLATYAYYRDWAKKKDQVKAISQAITACIEQPEINEQTEIHQLLDQRHFVVLQGAPGTGKTYNAMLIAKKFDKTFFEQFHAETTYADFVYGIKPKLNVETLGYEPNKGILYQAIKYAQENSKQKVLLIIDEINRANLANVLGPVFYLFEYQANEEERHSTIKIGDLELKQLPSNLRVIATMNTADRSLAVVDFALRRRFAWYTIVPHTINVSQGQVFHKEAFDDVSRLFDKYANDEELNLQPGPSYFITNGPDHEAEFKERVIYELMPLIKEYFTEGLMVKARDEFGKLFFELTKKQLYL
jgi:5-methylcytosine-specific restriction protein B